MGHGWRGSLHALEPGEITPMGDISDELSPSTEGCGGHLSSTTVVMETREGCDHTSDHRPCCRFLDTQHCCGHPLDRSRMIDDSKKDIDHLQPEMVDVRADTGVLAVHRP